MKIGNNFNSMSNIEKIKFLILILCTLTFVAGLIIGQIIGQYNHIDYIEKIMNNSANTNNLIRFDNDYYQIYHYNISNCKFNTSCFKNLTFENFNIRR